MKKVETFLRVLPTACIALGVCSLAWNQYGSIAARDWLPYACVFALALAGVLFSGVAVRPPTAAAIGTAGLLALAAWDAVSITWSPVPSLARDEALLVLLYAIVFALPLVVVRNAAERRSAVTFAVAALVGLAVVGLIRISVVSSPTDGYEHGRLTFPISYVNAQAALCLLPFWPAVVIGADRARSVLVRAAALGGACALLAEWLLTQSKGGLVALVFAGIVLLAICRERLRLLVPMLIPAILVGASYRPLTRPFRERSNPDFASAIHSAGAQALALTGVAAFAGLAYAFVDRRVRVAARVSRVVGVALAALVACAVIGGAAAFFVVEKRPGHFVAQKWAHFKRLPGQEHGSSHLTSLGSNRYDFWRVDLDLARHHPLAGVGARGFAQRYLAVRRSDETPARSHSLELDVLAETGVVGLLLLVAGVGVPLAVALVRARSSTTVAGLAAAAVYGVVHASADWIWTFPAIGATLFLFLGLANAGGAKRDEAPPVLPRAVAAVGGVLAVAVAAGAFGLPWTATRLTTSALQHPAAAGSRLRWARRLDPLSVDPWLAEAALAQRPRDAVVALRRAVAQQPDVSALRYQLAQAELRAGRKRAAREELLVAHRLDPRDPLIAAALARSR